MSPSLKKKNIYEIVVDVVVGSNVWGVNLAARLAENEIKFLDKLEIKKNFKL